MAITILQSMVASRMPLPDSDVDLHFCWSAGPGAGAELLVVAAPEQRVQDEGDAPPELLPRYVVSCDQLSTNQSSS